MWNLPPPPGFQGLLPEKPVTMYRRHLPHWRQDGAAYFVTFRLHDSLPRAKLAELEAIRKEWAQQNQPPHTDEQLDQLTRITVTRIETWLDQGMGSCCLKDPGNGKLVVDALHYFDDRTYELDCFVVMPNHVHVIMRPLTPLTDPLEKILQSRKLHTALEINRRLGVKGRLWQNESFDRIIRDEEHLYRAIQYIGMNPAKAGLNQAVCPRWIRPSWEALGWRFES